MMNEEGPAATPRPRPAVWPWIALGLVLAVGVGWRVFGPGARPRAADNEPHPAIGTRLETLALQPLTGDAQPLSLDDLRGQVALVNFWGPWCPPCREEFPHLAELEQHFRDEPGFRFVSVSASGGPGDDRDMAQSTAAYLKQQRAQFPTYRDANSVTRNHLAQVAGLPGIGYPTTVVLDGEGTIRGLWQGYAEGLEREMHRTIEQALDPQPPPKANP
ncbi:MAG: TlpA disulfide reductase family protein [Pirellulaceae bacterium]